jgi:hypothetical protein
LHLQAFNFTHADVANTATATAVDDDDAVATYGTWKREIFPHEKKYFDLLCRLTSIKICFHDILMHLNIFLLYFILSFTCESL